MQKKIFIAAMALGSFGALADEGMWTYDNFPKAELARRYGTKIDDAWLNRLQQATVRLETGCTGSFVSANGLILTNHHCAAKCIADLSKPELDLSAQGYLAADRAHELPCPGYEVSVLIGTEDITARIASAVTGLNAAEAGKARKRRRTELEAACEQADIRCESVSLYDGGQYFLYKYRRYTDLRLAFAPEDAIAAFGGDPDNFQFPRYCLDMSLLRAYENGKPAKVVNFLPINFDGPAAGELVFVSGHPGSTDRQLTVAQLQFLRDVQIPNWLLRNSELRGRLIQFGKRDEEARRQVENRLDGLENSIKVRRKELDALLDERLLADKSKRERELQAQVARDAKLGATDAWKNMAAASAQLREIYLPYLFTEGRAGFAGDLFFFARQLVRAAAERDKPNTERLREYTDAALKRVKVAVLAPTPVYPEVEQLLLSFSLERMREWLGPDAAVIKQVIGKESPDSLARRLVQGSRLGDVAARRALWEGGQAAIDASTDPMILLAKSLDAGSRAWRKRYEDEVESPTTSAAEHIARARFAIQGARVYPDATFTLRLNYGKVAGWIENGAPVEPFTTLATAYDRATGQAPFSMPDRWLKAKPTLDLSTRFDLSTTNDIVGGNSGSALVNARGELVGLIFDGNIHSISGGYWYDEEKNRAVAVHPAIIRLALTRVYGATALAQELGIR